MTKLVKIFGPAALIFAAVSITFAQAAVPASIVGQAPSAPILVEQMPIRIPPAEQTHESYADAVRNGHWCNVYPALAIRLGQQGNVALTFRISEEGTVTDVRVMSSSGHQALDEAAARCAATWRFQAARRKQEPVAVLWSTEFSYSLDPLTIRARDQGGVQTQFQPELPGHH